MNPRDWGRWVMQTARTWDDLSPVIRACGLDSVDDDHRRMIEYELYRRRGKCFSLRVNDRPPVDGAVRWVRLRNHLTIGS